MFKRSLRLPAIAVLAAAAAAVASWPAALVFGLAGKVEATPATPPKMVHRFAEISKTEELDDGTIKVFGYASTESEDSDGEVITADAMKAALPDYLKFGAVREMHDAKKAAGTAIEARVDDDGRTFFGAHVVDSEAVKKVKAGVYKGFSIGGRATARDEVNKSLIKGLKLVEVSLVDRPANPGAVFTCFKADADDKPVEQPEQSPEELEKAAVDELATMLDAGTVKPSEVVALLKRAKEQPAPEPVVQKTESATVTLRKGLGSIADLACTIKSLRWLIRDQIDEAAREGDGSPVPGQLREAAKSLLAILEVMVAEESAEFAAALDAYGTDNAPGAMIAYAAQAELTKAAKTGPDLGELRKAVGAADDADLSAVLVKVTAMSADLAKAQDGLAKATDSLTKAEAEVNRLKALPAPGKALLKALTKGEDVTPIDPEAQKAAKAEEERIAGLSGEDRAREQLRKMFKQSAPA